MLANDPHVVDSRPSDKRDIVLWTPEKIGGLYPVGWNKPTPGLIEDFARVLREAEDEKPLQEFFESAPQALLTGIVNPHRGWVVPRPKIQKPNGGCWIPDFVLCTWSSVGPDWFIVELESPRKSPLISSGDRGSLCNHAVDQIGSYRSAIEEHGHFLRGAGWPKLHGKFNGVVVMGRREDPLRAKFPDRLRQAREAGIEIMSYDRIFEKCEEFQKMIEGRARTATLRVSDRPDRTAVSG